MYRRLLPFILLCLAPRVYSQPVPVGHWREHFPYGQAAGMVSGKEAVFCATPYGIFSVSLADHAFTRYSKVNGLHDAGIATIGYHESSQSLVIAYQNSNLDVLRKEAIVNIPDILQKQVPGDKHIYNIAFQGNHAWLSTGLGIITVDLDRHEITDTYPLGRVNASVTDGRYGYAATGTGVKRALLQGGNLADLRNWTNISSGIMTSLTSIGQQVIGQVKDTLFIWKNDQWVRWFSNGKPILRIQTSGNTLFVCHPGAILQLSPEGAVINSFNAQNPSGATSAGDAVWIADAREGLIQSANGIYKHFSPNSPGGLVAGDMIVHNGALWAAAGTVTGNWQSTGNRNGFYRFEREEWTNYPVPDALHDVITLCGTDEGVYAGSFGGGVLNEQLKVIAPDLQVAGMATDREGNLWVSVFGADNNLLVKKKDNSWLKFPIPIFHIANAVSQVLVDDVQQKWIVSPLGNGLFVFNHGSSLENTLDDKWKLYQPGVGRGNLPGADVRCVARDLQGWIWVGTTRGVAVIQCASEVFSAAGCDAYLPIVQQGSFAGYLFQHEQVNTIAVDGANRKWVGTQNGAWLISPDGDKIIEQFNTTNSPLPDNVIYHITVHPQTGEVFFATAAGLLSWRGTATEGSITQGNDVLVFPNPVPPAYEGTIAIRGLVRNAIVKITDVSGKLVFQSRANGGQAVWSGRDYTGHRPQSGVYLVFSSDETGKEKLVTKLVFIH